MNSLFARKDLGLPSQLCVIFALMALFALLIGRFWWYGGTTSWAGSIRISLLSTLLIALVHWRAGVSFLRRNTYAILVGAFLLYLAANSLFIGDGKAARRVLLLVAFLVGVAFVTSYSRISLNRLLAVMAAFSALVAAFSIVNLSIQGALNFEYRQDYISQSGISGFADFENSILAALQMGFSCIVALWLFFKARSTGVKASWLLCVAVMLVYIYLTYGRTGWLATAASSGILFFWMVEPRWRIRLLLAGLCLSLVVTVLFQERIAYELFERKLTHRDEIWRMVLELMPGHWIFGHGADAHLAELLGLRPLGGDTPVLIAHAHSIYMEILFNYGVVGVALVLTIIMTSFWRLHCQRKDPIAVLGLAVMFGGALGMAFDFSSFVSTPNLLWLWFWLPVAWTLALSANSCIYDMINVHSSAGSAT